MRAIKISLFFALAALLSSCGYSEEFKEVNFENQFIIAYPDYMEECDDLTPIADLQYKNSYRNTYSIVRVEDKADKSLLEFQKEGLDVIKNYDLLSNPLVTDSFYRESLDFTAIDVQMYGIMEDENIYYWHSAFESKGKFYEVVCWTRSMDRKQRYGADIEKIISSFKPLI